MDDQTEAGALARYHERLNEIHDRPEIDAEMIREARRVYDDELERLEKDKAKTIVQNFARRVVNMELRDGRDRTAIRYKLLLMDLDRSLHVASSVGPTSDVQVDDLCGLALSVVKKVEALGFGWEILQGTARANGWGPEKLYGTFKRVV